MNGNNMIKKDLVTRAR